MGGAREEWGSRRRVGEAGDEWGNRGRVGVAGDEWGEGWSGITGWGRENIFGSTVLFST